jgi:aminoglycoside 6'-N-acetyltransferase I
MMPVEIRICTANDFDDWAAMREAMWPEENGLADEIDSMLAADGLLNLIARKQGVAVGLAEASIRRDYVNGCETSPVAFLEGIYVVPDARREGVAQALVQAVENWARAQGVAEFASDAFLENDDSHRMHIALGFKETERVVYFRKQISG